MFCGGPSSQSSLEFTKYLAIFQDVPVHKALHSLLNILPFAEDLLAKECFTVYEVLLLGVYLILPLCPHQSLDAPTSMM